MLEAILLDNDVILKMCAFAASNQLVEIATVQGCPPVLLAVAKYSLRSQVSKYRSIPEYENTVAQLEIFMRKVKLIEPTEDEINFAADLEEKAIRNGFHLDAGESQLVAVLIHRCSPLLITGDKRAIIALSKIAPQTIEGRVACFEQVVATVVIGNSFLESFRTSVCKSRTVDKAIANCFSCSSPSVTLEEVMAGLRSYIAALRCNTGKLLINSDDLVAVTSKKNSVRLT